VTRRSSSAQVARPIPVAPRVNAGSSRVLRVREGRRPSASCRTSCGSEGCRPPRFPPIPRRDYPAPRQMRRVRAPSHRNAVPGEARSVSAVSTASEARLQRPRVALPGASSGTHCEPRRRAGCPHLEPGGGVVHRRRLALVRPPRLGCGNGRRCTPHSRHPSRSLASFRLQ